MNYNLLLKKSLSLLRYVNEIGNMNQNNNSSLVIYKSKDGAIQLDVKLENETVWLSANQMASLFDRDEKTIRKHVNNVFNENELVKENNTHFLRVDGVKQSVAFYSLDVVISVGYRVKSQRGTQFRIWATSVLKLLTPLPKPRISSGIFFPPKRRRIDRKSVV